MKRSGGGMGWLVLMAIPPVLVVGGLVALFVWQGARGGVRGKWQKPPTTEGVVTNGLERVEPKGGKQ